MSGPAFDIFDDCPDDDDDDNLMSLGRTPPAYLVIQAPHHGVLQASVFEGPDMVSAIGTAAPKIDQHVGLAKPPRIWWAWAMRLVISTKGYRAEFEPRIAEMYDEYYECIARGDERTAWR